MICENCKCEYTKLYGSGRFCSKECSCAFSGKNSKGSKKPRKNYTKKQTCCISCNSVIFNRGKYCKDCKDFSGYKILFNKLNINDSNLLVANNKAIDLLKKEYFDNEKSMTELKNIYNIQLNTLHFFFKKNNLNLKTLSEAQSEAYLNGKQVPHHNLQYCKSGWHITWDNKKVYLRSSYEYDYARNLDKDKILYEVESKRIKYFDSVKNSTRIAIVDFYLPETNTLVEIKSSYTLDIQNMKDRVTAFNKNGFDFKLILDKKETEFH